MSCEKSPSRGWSRQPKTMPRMVSNGDNIEYSFGRRDLSRIRAVLRAYDSLSKANQKLWQEKVAEMGLTKFVESGYDLTQAPTSSLAEELFSQLTFEASKVPVTSKSSK